MKNKIKYFLIIALLTCIIVFIFFIPSIFYSQSTCDNKLDVYRWDLDVFRLDDNQNRDSLIQKIKINMDPVFSFSKEDYDFLMQDPTFKIISDSTYAIFSDRVPYIEEISEGFCRYQSYFPSVEDPKIIIYLDDYITQVANPSFSPPFFPVDYHSKNWVSLGLNWFLGPDHAFYQSIPDYLRLRYDSVYISPMIFHQLGMDYINSNTLIDFNDETFLASMISTAKPYFFAKHMLPNVPEYRIFGFTLDEMQFAYENEEFFWKDILLKEQMIYSSDRELKDLYIIPGPNLNCPSRLGTWLGFKILDSYFINKKVSLKDILLESNFKKILNESNYQP